MHNKCHFLAHIYIFLCLFHVDRYILSCLQVDPIGEDSADNQSSFDSNTLHALLTRLLPTAVVFCGDCDGDARVIVIFALRKLLPQLANCYHTSAALHQCFRERVLQAVPLQILLQDNPPIPQYAVRLLAEIASSSESCCMDIAISLCSAQRSHDHFNIFKKLLDLLEGGRTRDRDSNDSAPAGGEYTFTDGQQVAILLRCLINSKHSDVQRELIDSGLVEAVATTMVLAAGSRNVDMLVVVLDLLYGAMRCVHSEGGRSGQSHIGMRERNRVTAALSGLAPQLLELLLWRVSSTESRDRQSLDSTTLYVIHDGAIRALTLLAELQVAAVVDGLTGAGKHCTALALANADVSTVAYIWETAIFCR